MGSVDADPDEFVVLVTGYGPFKSEYPQNPSWEIARDLPAYLPAAAEEEGDGAAATAGRGALPPVRIVVYPEPIRVSYATVRHLVPRLWGDDGGEGWQPPRRVDLVLHIGMAGPRLHYALERVGRRDGYRLPDVDGAFLRDLDKEAGPAEHGVWHDVPPALETHVDLDDVLRRWRAYAAAAGAAGRGGGQPDLRISVDAGRYLCDFMYFSSLAHLYKRQKAATEGGGGGGAGKDADNRRRVVFLHVPASAAPERIAVGRALVLDLVRSLAETEVAAAAARAQQEGAPEKVASVEEETAAATPFGADADVATGKWYRE